MRQSRISVSRDRFTGKGRRHLEKVLKSSVHRRLPRTFTGKLLVQTSPSPTKRSAASSHLGVTFGATVMMKSRNPSNPWNARLTQRTFHPDRPLVTERRKPENAPIRRWFKLGAGAWATAARWRSRPCCI